MGRIKGIKVCKLCRHQHVPACASSGAGSSSQTKLNNRGAKNLAPNLRAPKELYLSRPKRKGKPADGPLFKFQQVKQRENCTRCGAVMLPEDSVAVAYKQRICCNCFDGKELAH